jgi:hypothetical protein
MIAIISRIRSRCKATPPYPPTRGHCTRARGDKMIIYTNNSKDLYRVTYTCGHYAYTSCTPINLGQVRECPTCVNERPARNPYRRVMSIKNINPSLYTYHFAFVLRWRWFHFQNNTMQYGWFWFHRSNRITGEPLVRFHFARK